MEDLNLIPEGQNRYEISFLLKNEDDSQLKKVLAKNGAVILEEKPLQKARLAYPIKKQTHAFMGVLGVQISGEALKNVLADFKLDANIIRSLVTILTPGEKSRSVFPRKEIGMKEREEFRKRSLAKDGKKSFASSLTNEALEKKIEEIMK